MAGPFGGGAFGGGGFGGGFANSGASDLVSSDLGIVLPQFHTIDMFSKEGGFHTSRTIASDVTSVFLPGIIVGSDSSETVRYQHRKVFLKNLSRKSVYYCKVYGFNTRNNGLVKMALEKGQNQLPLIDGSEVVSTYLNPPGLWGSYAFTEFYSNQSVLIGNNGILSAGRGQGIWLRQQCLKNISDYASDLFQIGILWSELYRGSF